MKTLLKLAMLCAAFVNTGFTLVDTEIGFPHPPLGYDAYCRRGECVTGEDKQVPLSKDNLGEIIEVQNRVNNSIRYQPEVDDVWSELPDGGFGDCDDYVATKRRLLIERGFPAGALSVAAVFVRGVPHMVLLVNTTDGFLILDSLVSRIGYWDEYPFGTYVWSMRSRANGSWTVIGKK